MRDPLACTFTQEKKNEEVRDDESGVCSDGGYSIVVGTDYKTRFVDGNPQPPPPPVGHLLVADGNPQLPRPPQAALARDGNPQPPPPPQLKKWLVADGNPQPPRPPLSAMTV